MTTRIDSMLVEAARGGDQAAMEALLRAARPQAKKYAERYCIADSEDATQEALWVVYQKMPSLRSAAAFSGWLLKIVMRICFGFMAPLWRRVEAMVSEPADVDAVDPTLRIDLERALEHLQPAYRDVIVLHYFCDFPVAEAAGRLGITESACKVRLHRARTVLREYLDPAAPEPEPD